MFIYCMLSTGETARNSFSDYRGDVIVSTSRSNRTMKSYRRLLWGRPCFDYSTIVALLFEFSDFTELHPLLL